MSSSNPENTGGAGENQGADEQGGYSAPSYDYGAQSYDYSQPAHGSGAPTDSAPEHGGGAQYGSGPAADPYAAPTQAYGSGGEQPTTAYSPGGEQPTTAYAASTPGQSDAYAAPSPSYAQPEQPQYAQPEQPQYAQPQPSYGQPAPGYAPGYVQATPTNTFAILSLVLSLVGLFTWITAPIGVIFGHLARRQIRETGEQGDGMALTGLITGYIIAVGGLLLVIGYIVLMIFVIGAAGVGAASSY